MPALSFVDVVLASLTLSLSAQTSVEEDPVLWSGRLSSTAEPAALSAGSSFASLDGGMAHLSLPGFIAARFAAAACAQGQEATLAVVGALEAVPRVLLIAQADSEAFLLRKEFSLPAAPVARPAVFAEGGDCTFAVLLGDGSVAVASVSGLRILEEVVPRPRDVSELPDGAVSVGTKQGVLVVVVDEALVSVELSTGATERIKLPMRWSSPVIASLNENRVFGLDAEGSLWSYRPFATQPNRMIRGTSPAPGGLTVLADPYGAAGELLWGTMDGRVVVYDGITVRDLASFGAPITHGLLQVDLLDVGRPQIVAAMDDGQLGIVQIREDGSTRAERFAIGIRPSTAPVVRVASDRLPAEILIGNGARARAFSLGQVTAAPFVRDSMSVSPGEVILGGVSSVQRTRLHPAESGITEVEASREDDAVVDAEAEQARGTGGASSQESPSVAGKAIEADGPASVRLSVQGSASSCSSGGGLPRQGRGMVVTLGLGLWIAGCRLRRRGSHTS